MDKFHALVARKGAAAAFEDLETAALPEGELLVEVKYSSLNYKDGIAVSGAPGVIRNYPMVCGIDLAGVVTESSTGEFSAGQEIAVTGCGLSETWWGGYAQLARVKREWAVPLPVGISMLDAMGIGTAGFTAMQCADALEAHASLSREVVVTGAAGGVGSIAIAILAQLGATVVASTGRPEEEAYLKGLGASAIIDRGVLSAASKRPMEAERWGGAVDTAGGETIAGLLRQMAANTSIASCGLAGGSQLATTVFPFILRGVNLLGINSVEVANAERRRIWGRLAELLPMQKLKSITTEVPLSAVPTLAPDILAGKIRGRVVVKI